MRIDGPGCTLPTHVAGEGHPHPAPRRFCEERPRERRHLWPVRPTGSARRWRPLHARSRRPAAPRGSAHHYPHGRVLGERRDGEPVRRKAGGLAPGAICGLLVVVVVMTLGGGDGEEGGTAPAVERRRGEGEREGPGGGGDRGGRDGLHGRRRREGERWGVQA